MKISWSVGEASGDHIASLLMQEWEDSSTVCVHRGVFGPKMRSFPHQAIEHQENLSVNGFGDTLFRIPFFIRFKQKWYDELIQNPPDLLVLVDFSGFNRPLMKMALNLGVKTLVIAPPQIWVWRTSRAKDYMQIPLVATLPIDYLAWKNQGAQVEYFGCPHLEGLNPSLPISQSVAQWDDHLEIDLLMCPGSRKSQVLRSLPVMLDLACLQSIQGKVVILAANQELTSVIDQILITQETPLNIEVSIEPTFNMSRPIRWAWSTLGTHSLKLAHQGIPTSIIHKLDFITYWVGRLLIKKKLFALPNILCKRNALQEIIFTGNKVSWVNQVIQRPDDQVAKSLADQLQKELGDSHFSKECSRMIDRMIHG